MSCFEHRAGGGPSPTGIPLPIASISKSDAIDEVEALSRCDSPLIDPSSGPFRPISVIPAPGPWRRTKFWTMCYVCRNSDMNAFLRYDEHNQVYRGVFVSYCAFSALSWGHKSTFAAENGGRVAEMSCFEHRSGGGQSPAGIPLPTASISKSDVIDEV